MGAYRLSVFLSVSDLFGIFGLRGLICLKFAVEFILEKWLTNPRPLLNYICSADKDQINNENVHVEHLIPSFERVQAPEHQTHSSNKLQINSLNNINEIIRASDTYNQQNCNENGQIGGEGGDYEEAQPSGLHVRPERPGPEYVQPVPLVLPVTLNTETI